jgi:hypothetical protein
MARLKVLEGSSGGRGFGFGKFWKARWSVRVSRRKEMESRIRVSGLREA